MTGMPFGSPHSATASVRPSAVCTRCSRCSGVTISSVDMARMLAPSWIRLSQLARHVADGLLLAVGLGQNCTCLAALGRLPVVAEQPPLVRRFVVRRATDYPASRDRVIQLRPGIFRVRHQPLTDTEQMIAFAGLVRAALLQS